MYSTLALAALFGQTLASNLTGAPANSSVLERRHIEMVYPNQRNFDNQEWGHFNPLAPDGSNYPCRPRKGLKLKVKGSPTHFTAGVKFEVRFAGEEGKGAVHGGGSCQFSLSKGHSPNRDTRFYVIKSIEGGCPKRNSDGNLKPGEEPDKYEVEIPPQFEPGDWVFAWTWINRIGGEPEYYMNCSPIRIVAGAEKSSLQRRREQGSPKETEAAAPEAKQPGTDDKEPGPSGKGKDSKEKDKAPKETKKPSPSGKELGGIDQYPGVFMANLGEVSGGCTTSEALRARKAILYPHPGKIVERGNGDADPNLITQPCDGNPHNKNSDMTFEKVLHKESSASTGGISSMLGKDREASKAAISEYFQHWDGKTAKNETREVREARKADYASLTRQQVVTLLYYNLATDFYEYGWCQSFHFCRFAHGESFASAMARHEHTLAHRIGIKKDMKVLDVGCGVGGPARQMAKFTGANITGITINEYQVERARRYAELEGLSRQLQFVQGDFMSLPFEGETFDAAYAIEATVHAPVLEDVYRQVYDVLKPGGVFGLYEWVMTDAYDDGDLRHGEMRLGIEQGDGVANMQTARTAVEAIKAAGFELLEVEDLARSTDGGNSARAPWYWPLDGSSWRCANTIGDVLGTFRMTPAGRTVAHALLTILETVGLAPPGTKKTADSLARAADALVAAGKEGLFTPMFLMVARKPFAGEQKR